jgi:hypothetical protein
MHLQAKNKRDGCAPAGQRRRGTDMHQQDEEERARYAPQAKNRRDRCAPTGQRRRGTDVHQQDSEGMARYAPAGKE